MNKFEEPPWARSGRPGSQSPTRRCPGCDSPHTGPAQATCSSEVVENQEVGTPGKTLKDSERQTATAVTREDEPEVNYALRLTQAVNAGISKRWGEQPNPLSYGRSTQLAADLAKAGVRLETATSAIAKLCAAKRGEKPGTVEYFRAAIFEAHQADEQRAFERANPSVASNGADRGGAPTNLAAGMVHVMEALTRDGRSYGFRFAAR